MNTGYEQRKYLCPNIRDYHSMRYCYMLSVHNSLQSIRHDKHIHRRRHMYLSKNKRVDRQPTHRNRLFRSTRAMSVGRLHRRKQVLSLENICSLSVSLVLFSPFVFDLPSWNMCSLPNYNLHHHS